MAATNPALFDFEGERKSIKEGGEILKNRLPVNFYPGMNLESIANRDSTAYKEPYKLDKVETLLRGTLRFEPYCDVVYGLKQIGLLEMNNCIPKGCNSWKSIVESLKYIEKLDADPKNESEIVIKAMEELNLFTDEALSDKVKSADNILDAFANHLR